MRKRRASAGGGLIAAVLIVVVVLIASAGSGGDSTGSGLSFGHTLQNIRARNLQLQSMIVVLTERQTLRIGGYGGHQSSAPEPPAAKAITHETNPEPAPALGSSTANECDPNYEGACLDPNASDYDCADGSGDGPDYTGEVEVVGEDEFGLDADADGVGCEAQ